MTLVCTSASKRSFAKIVPIQKKNILCSKSKNYMIYKHDFPIQNAEKLCPNCWWSCLYCYYLYENEFSLIELSKKEIPHQIVNFNNSIAISKMACPYCAFGGWASVSLVGSTPQLNATFTTIMGGFFCVIFFILKLSLVCAV